MSRETKSRIDIIDCQSIFAVLEYLREVVGKPTTLNYSFLVKHLERRRGDVLSANPREAAVAVASIDPLSDAQQRFLRALAKLNISVTTIDYRHAQYGTGTGAVSDRQAIGGSSLAPLISYMLGLLAERSAPQVIVVSGDFALYHPLLDFVRRKGEVALAFFRKVLEPRWASVGLFDKSDDKNRIRFIDLDPCSENLLGFDLRAADEGTERNQEDLILPF